MLIGAGEEAHIVALEPLIAGHGIGGYGAVGVADMQVGRGIVNGGGNIVITLACIAHICKSSCGINCDIPNYYSLNWGCLSTEKQKYIRNNRPDAPGGWTGRNNGTGENKTLYLGRGD
jgi:hypothetical protein